MSAEFATTTVVELVAATYDFADSTTPVTFAPGAPADVMRIIGVITEASTGTSVVTVAVRNVDDTSSTTIGTFTVPAGLALNSVFSIDIAGVKTAAVVPTGEASQVAQVTTGRVLGYQTNQPGVIEVNPGQEMSFTSDAGGSAGMANLFVQYSRQGSNPLRFNPTVIAFTYA